MTKLHNNYSTLSAKLQLQMENNCNCDDLFSPPAIILKTAGGFLLIFCSIFAICLKNISIFSSFLVFIFLGHQRRGSWFLNRLVPTCLPAAWDWIWWRGNHHRKSISILDIFFGKNQKKIAIAGRVKIGFFEGKEERKEEGKRKDMGRKGDPLQISRKLTSLGDAETRVLIQKKSLQTPGTLFLDTFSLFFSFFF